MLAQTLEYSGTKVDYTLVDVCRYVGAEACYEGSKNRREEFENQCALDYVHSEPFVEVAVIRILAKTRLLVLQTTLMNESFTPTSFQELSSTHISSLTAVTSSSCISGKKRLILRVSWPRMSALCY